MKKKYMKPEMEAFNMKVESLICLSGSDEAAKKDGKVLAKELEDWEEDFDHILW
jgi:hypothetical protein